MTVNISLPKDMYEEVQLAMAKQHYMSFSEYMRDAVRKELHPGLTANGFTPEVEAKILKIAASPTNKDVVWDGKTPFVKFALTHQPKKHDSPSKNRSISGWS
jgi:hypothetical protein